MCVAELLYTGEQQEGNQFLAWQVPGLVRHAYATTFRFVWGFLPRDS